MAESIPSPSDSVREQNISMLFDKLIELKMSTENPTDAHVFGKVEREYFAMK